MARPIFNDDDPVECCQCGKFIYPGNDYISSNTRDFCTVECFGKYLVDITGYKERRVESAEDKELNYGDMRYDY